MSKIKKKRCRLKRKMINYKDNRSSNSLRKRNNKKSNKKIGKEQKHKE